MSYCQEKGEDGKDKVIHISEDDYRMPINTPIAKIEPEEEEGLITQSGEINWGCPCLGGMATGPCGQEFREAFSCFHYSEADPKGSDCIDHFKVMSECMSQYPDLYPERSGDDEEREDDSQINIADLEQTSTDKS